MKIYLAASILMGLTFIGETTAEPKKIFIP